MVRVAATGFGVPEVSAPMRLSVLGATGSIGKSTLDLVGRTPDRFEVVALTAQTNVAALAALARKHRARIAVIGDEHRLGELRDALAGTGIKAAAGADALNEAALMPADCVMAAIVGAAGLRPTFAAATRGARVALANKECLVSAGHVFTAEIARSGAELLPVDSEHSAAFQALAGADPKTIEKIVLTASGGPFRTWTREALETATPEQALKHPNWSMGAKVTIDSATLMNKGLELIEAYHLFPLGADRFEIVIHPQSVVHSLVEYVDGSVLAQLGAPDMRIPIAYTLAWPERMATPCQRLDLVRIGTLSFEAPDLERFPALGLARAALEAGGARPAVLNAANEIAVAAFLAGRIGFLEIASIAAESLDRYEPCAPTSIDEVLEIDGEARSAAEAIVTRYSH
jgi:1-deoxy-D-xylulose-5-phosphate reductoisomerase